MVFTRKTSKSRFWAFYDLEKWSGIFPITFCPNRHFTNIVKNSTAVLKSIEFSQYSGNFRAIRKARCKALVLFRDIWVGGLVSKRFEPPVEFVN